MSTMGKEKRKPTNLELFFLDKQELDEMVVDLKEEIIEKMKENIQKSNQSSAKKAFEIIITAFNRGDKKTLKNLVSQDVYNAFASAIDSKTNNANAQFYSLVIDSIEDAKVENGKMIISIKFISEQIIDNKEESIIKNQDVWVFEKPVNASNPIWILTSTQLLKYKHLKKRIKKNEGFSKTPYKDQLGNLTIGYGHLIKKKETYFFKKSISKNKLDSLFESDFNL